MPSPGTAKAAEQLRAERDPVTARVFLRPNLNVGTKLNYGISRMRGSNRTRGNGLQLPQGRFSLDIRENIFMESVVKDWRRMPRESPSLEGFKRCVTLGNVV